MQTNHRVLFIVEVAVFAAISVILDFFSFSAWGQGGSISFQMIPTFIMSFRWGYRGGLITGFIFGLLQLVLGAYIIHPIQGLLDYPVAFTVVGFSALFWHQIKKSVELKKTKYLNFYIVVACLLGSLLRLAVHIISAVIFFGASVPSDQSVLLYASIYNASYVLPSFLISSVVILMLVKINRHIIFYKN